MIADAHHYKTFVLALVESIQGGENLVVFITLYFMNNITKVIYGSVFIGDW